MLATREAAGFGDLVLLQQSELRWRLGVSEPWSG